MKKMSEILGHGYFVVKTALPSPILAKNWLHCWKTKRKPPSRPKHPMPSKTQNQYRFWYFYLILKNIREFSAFRSFSQKRSSTQFFFSQSALHFGNRQNQICLACPYFIGGTMLIFPSPFPSLLVTGRTLSDQPGSFSLVPKMNCMHRDVTRQCIGRGAKY